MMNWNDRFHCERPNTVGHRVFTSIRDLIFFVNGEKIVYDDEFSVWRVPAWKAGIDAASAACQRECDRWGSE